MTPDILIRIEGRAGRITLNRPKALNALNPAMCHAIAVAIEDWRDNPAVDLILLDAEGDKAFCAGGDIAEIYRHGTQGDYALGRDFWAEEYRLNAALAEYPKPIVSFMQGYVMGGGVGIGCHVKHRIVGDTTRISMPECGIGLVPDVGGTALLAGASGHMGDYLGLTGTRMSAGDAIKAGFADHYLPEAEWPALKSHLITTGTPQIAAKETPSAPLHDQSAEIDSIFSAPDLATIFDRLSNSTSPFAEQTLKSLRHHAPLAMACTLQLIRAQKPAPDVRTALVHEHRYTYRAQSQGDFLEGIRAQVIDKDRTPTWGHSAPDQITQNDIDAMLAPLGPAELTF